MRVLVVTAQPKLEANRRLVESGRDIGIGVEIVDATEAVVKTGFPAMDIVLNGKTALEPKPRGVLARVGNWRPETMLAMVEVLQSLGVPTPNSADAFRAGRDHWRSLVMLSQAALPVPKTLAGMDAEKSAVAAVSMLGLPVVVKLRRSRMGVGVIVCRQLDHLESVLDSLWRLGDEFVVQEWVECEGRSTRVLIAGDRAIAAAHFEAAPGEWRSNGARGGSAEQADLTDRQKDLAIAAAKALGLGLCGVDLLESRRGTLICEVNPTPGFKRVEEATGVDVASEIIRFVAELGA